MLSPHHGHTRASKEGVSGLLVTAYLMLYIRCMKLFTHLIVEQ